MIAPASDLPRTSLSMAPLIRTVVPWADTRPAPIQIIKSIAANEGAPTRSQEGRMDSNPFKISVLERAEIIAEPSARGLSQFVAGDGTP